MHLSLQRLPKVGAFLLAGAIFGSACSDMPTSSDSAVRSLLPTRVSAAAAASPTATVARVDVEYVSGGIDQKTWTMPIGTTAQFKATAVDSKNRVVTGLPVKFTSTNPAALRIDSTTGLGTGVAAGYFSVKATIGGVTGGTGNLIVSGTVATPAAAPVTPAPAPAPTTAPASSIAVQIIRFDGGSGAATVSAGVPLVPGALRPGQEGNVRVYVGGIEQPVYVTGLSSRHPDGSLRAVLVQLKLASLSATAPATGFIDLTTARPAAMTLSSPLVAPGAAAAATPAGLPQAAILPTSTSYLIATDLVGPTLSSAATTALGGNFATYESNFGKYVEPLWAVEGANWNEGDYYDRALIYYAFWARTGNATYWARAGRMAYQYRTGYLEAYAYGSTPHWSQLEGLEKHYLLTGDEASRQAVLSTAYSLSAYTNSSYMTATLGESRIAARVLHSQLLAWRLSPAGSAAVTFQGLNMATQSWGANVEAALAKIQVWQQTNGSYPAQTVCGGQLNYMVGLLNDALIKTYDYYVPTSSSRATLQSTMQTLVQRGADYLWNTQWLASNRAFQYASVDCTSMGVGGKEPAPDLNLLIAAGYGWLWKRTGNAQYLTEGDAIFAGGVTQAWLGGTKQFNENYTSSFRYLAYR